MKKPTRKKKPTTAKPAAPVATAALARIDDRPRVTEITPAQESLLKRTLAKGTTEDEFALYLWVAKKHHLDPFTRQLHCVKRFDTRLNAEVMTIQIGIDGYRFMAARSHADFGGVDEPEFEYQGDNKTLKLARVRVWKKGFDHPTIGIAFWNEYCPDLTKPGSFMWKKMPHGQLAKCAEALALRKAYPDLSDIYTNEEMAQAGDDQPQRTPGGREIIVEGSEGTREAAKAVADRKIAAHTQGTPQTEATPTKAPEAQKPAQTPPTQISGQSSAPAAPSEEYMRVIVSHLPNGSLFLLEAQMDEQMRNLAFSGAANAILTIGAQMHPTIPFAFVIEDKHFDEQVAMLKARGFEMRHKAEPKKPPTPAAGLPKANIPAFEKPQLAGLITKLRKTNSGKPFAMVTWNGFDIAIWNPGETYDELERIFKAKKSVVIAYREKPNADPSKPPYRDVVSFELAALQTSER